MFTLQSITQCANAPLIKLNTNCFPFSFQACAPRYVYYIFMDRMDPVGMCFTARHNFTQIRSHKPCVESGREMFSIFQRSISNLLNVYFLFPPPPHLSLSVCRSVSSARSTFSLCNGLPPSRRRCRHARRGTCGSPGTSRGVNPWARVTRPKTISPNFSSIHLAAQVSV